MSRGHGKRTQRPPELSPEQKAEFGIDDRDIPGGQVHLLNPQTHQQKVPAPEKLAEFRGMMAHGVPPEGNTYHRPAKSYQPEYTGPGKPPVPVPVYIVQGSAGARTFKHVFTNKIVVPSAVIEPVRLCSIDPDRIHMRLMNESSTGTGIRIGSLPDVTAGKGALLPAKMTSYLTIEAEDELFALPDDTGNSYTISVLLETETPGAS